uniref:Uncharacterized protein n=1 Tax=Cannabis sativa TaxID=3483 RepID=A0A803NHP5_CANSA
MNSRMNSFGHQVLPLSTQLYFGSYKNNPLVTSKSQSIRDRNRFQLANEEDRDYVARTHYLKNINPQEAENDASREFPNNMALTSIRQAIQIGTCMSPLNPFELYMITGSREFSNYFNSSSSSDDYDMDFENLLSTSCSKKGKKQGTLTMVSLFI